MSYFHILFRLLMRWSQRKFCDVPKSCNKVVCQQRKVWVVCSGVNVITAPSLLTTHTHTHTTVFRFFQALLYCISNKDPARLKTFWRQRWSALRCQNENSKTERWWMDLTHVCHTHLEWIKTGDNSAVFHLAALGRVGELALAVRPRTRPSLEFPTDLQCQPLCVPDLCHIHCHFDPDGRGWPSWLCIRQMRLYLCTTEETVSTDEKK